MVGAKFCEGACVGDDVGLGVVGAAVGLRVGEDDGLLVCPAGRVGLKVGERVGAGDGKAVPKFTVGRTVGAKF